MAARYRQAELEAFILGDGVNLTYSQVSRASKSLSKEDARLLHYCRTFRTLEKHALQWSREAKFQGLRELSNVRLPGFMSGALQRFRNYAERHRSEIAVDAKQLASVKSRLEAFAASGFLVSDEDLVRQCKKTRAGPDSDSPSVTALGMATRGREEILRRGIASYLDNGTRFGRSVEIIVVDDALEPNAQQRTHEVLEGLKNERHAPLRYASRRDRAEFADRLAAYSGLPGDLIRFALLGREPNDRTTGSCYNSLLLDAIGSCYVVADDDTLCQVSPAPEQQNSLALTSQFDPTEFWFYRDRGSTFAAQTPADQDFFAIHESLLGRGLDACLPDAEGAASLDLDRMAPALDCRLRMRGGRVAATLAGIVGDSGVGSTGYLSVGPASRRRLLRSKQDYLAFVESHQLARAVTRPTVSEGFFCMAGNLGLDNRSLLPPFMPVQRGSDALFGITLRKCFRDGYMGYLPWTVRHDPPHQRTQPLADFMQNAARLRFSEIVRQLITGAPEASSEGDDPSGLRRLGGYLQQISSGNLAEFEDTVKTCFWRSHSEAIAEASKYRDDPEIPDYYRVYREQHRKTVREAIVSPAYFVPRDMEGLGSDEEVRRLVQSLIHEHGRLLEHWPDLIQATRELREEGIRLTRPV